MSCSKQKILVLELERNFIYFTGVLGGLFAAYRESVGMFVSQHMMDLGLPKSRLRYCVLLGA